MKKVYDRFADEYIDESEKSPYAPPERYTEITEEILVENAARWFLTALKRLLDEDADHKDEPQTNADQHVQRVEYVGNDEKSRCWTCKHFERMHETPISSDGSYYTYVVCMASECRYEPKDEPKTQTKTQNSNLTFEKADEPQTDCAWK